MATTRKTTKNAEGVEANSPATFNEKDRNQYGGDYALIDSRKRKDGSFASNKRPINAGMFDIYEGDIVYKKEPTKKIHFTPAFYDPRGEESMADIATRLSEGFQFCRADDFSVRPEKRDLIKKNPQGNLSFMGMAEKALVLMWMPWEKYEEYKKSLRRASDEINKSMDEKLREAQAQMRRDFGGPYVYSNTGSDMVTTQEERFVPDER